MPVVILLFFVTLVNAFDLNSLSQSLKSQEIEGNFTQVKSIKDFPFPFKSSGTFQIVKSKKLIWKSLKPVKESIKIDKDGLFVLDSNNSWVKSKQNIDKGIFLELLSLDQKSLDKMFLVDLKGDKRSWDLTLKPKESILKQIFDFIKLSGGEYIKGIYIHEKRGDKSVIQFTNLKKVK